MRVLVIGSGGREHALCCAIAASPLCDVVFCAPGNPGIADVAERIAIGSMDLPMLVTFAKSNGIDLVVPGPEGPLVSGISNVLEAAGIPCCGPSREAAWLESSKSFTKEICVAADIPTAKWVHFDHPDLARAAIRLHQGPLVVKADGLAAGKGVVVAETQAEALEAIAQMMDQRSLGDAGAAILIEECLVGEEVSLFALCDGTTAIPLGVARDHKRLGPGDTGPNTGGMGAYSPVATFSQAQQDWVMERIIRPTLTEMAKRGTPYRGVLYAGLMVTADGIKLIEFNARFGDPECQALILRMDSDLLQPLYAAATGSGFGSEFRWKQLASMAVVMAAPGYPDAPEYGSEIRSLPVLPNVHVFHAGTDRDRFGKLRAVGGRVLTVCATGEDLATAHARVYSAIDQIDWPEGYYRRDIGWRGLL